MTDRKLPMTTLLVASGMLLGRGTGLVRELVMAARFGISRDADLAALAITIPDLLNTLFIGGAISAVLIPEFYRLEKQSPQKANQLVAQFGMIVGGVSLLLCGLLATTSHWVVNGLAPGFDELAHATATHIFWIVLIAFPLCTLTAVTSAALQARQAVVMPALGTLIFNSVLIIGTMLGNCSVIAISWLVVFAAGTRWLSQMWTCYRQRLWKLGGLEFRSKSLLTRVHAYRYAQTIGAVGASVSLPIIARAFASHIPGGIAYFNYASKLVEVPVGLFAAVLTMVVFPRVSRAVYAADVLPSKVVAQTTALVLLGALPAMVVFITAAEPITTLLFQHGFLLPENVRIVELLAKIGFLSLPAVTLTTHAMGICQAHGDMRFPFITNLLVLGLFLPVSWCAVLWYGLPGLMGSTVAVQWVQCLILARAVRRRHSAPLLGAGADGRVLVLCATTLGCLVFGWWITARWDSTWARLALAVGLGACCLSTCAWCLSQQLEWLTKVLFRRPENVPDEREIPVRPQRRAA